MIREIFLFKNPEEIEAGRLVPDLFLLFTKILENVVDKLFPDLFLKIQS